MACHSTTDTSMEDEEDRAIFCSKLKIPRRLKAAFLACESGGQRWLVHLSDHQTKAKGVSIWSLGGNTKDGNRGNCENVYFAQHLASKADRQLSSAVKGEDVLCLA